MAQIIQPVDFPIFNNLRPMPEEVATEEPKKEDEVSLHPIVIDPLEDPKAEVKEVEVEQEKEEIKEPIVEKTETDDFDPYAYYTLGTTLGVLEVPEGFEFDEKDPEGSILKAAEYTSDLNYRKAEEALLSEIQDQGLADLVKHGIEGGKFADLEKFFQATKQEIDYEKIDLDKEENQVTVYREYLKSTGRFTDSKIDKFIDALQDEDGLQDEAQKAKDYFIQEARSKKETLTREAQERSRSEQRMLQERQEKFMSALGSSSYSKPQQQKILNSFSSVELNDGRKMRAFEKTLVDIQTNPKHYIEFLALLNEYDNEKGFSFKKVDKQKETEITKGVLDKLREAAPTIGKGNRGAIEDKPIVPKENPYLKNITRY